MDEFLARLRFRRDHRWAPDHMSGYLDGELPEPRRRRMERHVAECDQCRRLAASLRLIVDALHRTTGVEDGPDLVLLAASVRGRLSGNQPPMQ